MSAVNTLKVSYLEYVNPDENSEKFYLTAQAPNWTTTAYGRIGSKGQVITKHDGSGAKKVIEKERKGYTLLLDEWVEIPEELRSRIGHNDGTPIVQWLLREIQESGVDSPFKRNDPPEKPQEEGDAIDKLSERALKAIELAAESPQQAVVAYAQLTADLEHEIDRLAVVQSHVDTLEVMLGMDKLSAVLNDQQQGAA